ncbi:major facilitator superfamily transporter [Botrytis cinerea]
MTLRDPEKAIGIDKEITSALPINFTGENLADCKETNIVTWDGPTDPQNPKNWTTRRKWRMTLIVSCFALLSPLTGTMIAPSTKYIASSLHTKDFFSIDLVSSIFLLGIGFGPLLLSPISEIYGRVPVLLLGNIFFILWNTVCGFSRNVGELIAFRLLTGFGGSAPLAVGNYYHESTGTGSLNYIATGIGFTLGAQVGGRLNNSIYKRLKGDKPTGVPEYRVALMLPGSILLPIGLFIYGWTGQYHTHWIAPNVGIAIFCAGAIMCIQSIQTYTIDAYSRYAASAISTLNALRSLTGFTFLLFAPAMYERLGHGWGNSLLAFILLL